MRNRVVFSLLTLVMILCNLVAYGQIQRCGTPDPSQVVYDNPLYKIGTNITIPTILHVIYASDGTGNVPDWQLQAQIDTLNAAYSRNGTRYSFYLAGVSRTQNNNWRNITRGSQAELDMTNALAIDPKHALNIYITEIGPLGWVIKWPWDVAETSRQHGVVLDYGSLPAGYITNYNEGDTGVHEVGHYLGLYHTFQNGCTSPGDEVDDTPYQRNPTSGCPNSRDTCPQPGLDPIHNYMDYSTDPCLYEFTPGQSSRMDAIVGQYKPSLGGTTLYFTSDFAIPTGRIWKFYVSTIKFSTGKRITTNGTLNADNVIFTASGASWNGIYFASTGSGTLKYCTLDKLTGGWASSAITIAGSSPYFENCTIDVLPGSYVFGVSSSGSGTSFNNPIFYKCTVRSASGPTFRATGSYGFISIHDTDIIHTSTYPAVSAENSSRIEFWIAGVPPYLDGKNKIKGGRLFANGNARIKAGDGAGSTSNNHFCNTAANTLEVASGGTIYAKYDYWHNGSAPTQIINGGTIYYSNNLGPSDCSDVLMMITGTSNESQPNQVSSDDLEQKLFEALSKSRAGLTAEAISLFIQIIESKQMPFAHTALLELASLYRETDHASISTFIEQLAKQDGQLKATAMKMLADLYSHQNKTVEALNLLDEILSSYPGTPDAFFAQLTKFDLYFAEREFDKAEDILNSIQSKSENEAISVAAICPAVFICIGSKPVAM